MSHQSLYRKYRPTTFESVAGQNHIERTLRNAVATDSVAHAYLFSGPRGTGKTTTARILAAALVCGHTADGEPDGSCEQCQQVNEGRHPDIIELDAASQTGVDNVREEIINNMHLATVHGKSKVYIIDEVHMLSKGAFNALLKTLEEPPAQVIFILCTTDPQKVLPTVRSRCQEFDFHPIAATDIAQRLRFIADSEGITADSAALELIARHADGGMRDAITLFEQLNAFSGGDIKVSDVEESMGGVSGDSLASLMFSIAKKETPATFVWVGEQVSKGVDLVEAVRTLLDYARDTYVTSMLGADATGVNRSADEMQIITEIAALFNGPQTLERILDLLFDLSDQLRWSTEPRILVELTLVRACAAAEDSSIEALAARIEALERNSVPVPTDDVTMSAEDAQAAIVSTAATASSAAPIASTVESAAPAPATSPAEISDDRAVLNRNWSAVLEQIRELSPSRQPLFSRALLQADTAKQLLIIEYPASAKFVFEKAKSDDNKEILTKALAAVYGHEVRYIFEQSSAPASDDSDNAKTIEQPSILEPTPPPEHLRETPMQTSSIIESMGGVIVSETTD